MDISEFYQTFFEEADELLADMEQHLLELDPLAPDSESLNAIFRAAHSIKGGAGTFGFHVLQETTHLLENLLDGARGGDMALSGDIINLFLETKDVMQEQLDAYKASLEPDKESYQYICQALRQLALEAQNAASPASADTQSAPPEAGQASSVATESPDGQRLKVVLSNIKDDEKQLLSEELGNLGTVVAQQWDNGTLRAELVTSISGDDISAVMCFILDASQITIEPVDSSQAQLEVSPAGQPAQAAATPAAEPKSEPTHHNAAPAKHNRNPVSRPRTAESTIRVSVDKVDQIINLVGELVITQSMISQLSSTLDPSVCGDLLNSMGLLERNARDLQEAVMSIRMMPMEFVFSRFPRLVRDLAVKLDKQVELTLLGNSTELDKSLLERIVDPLTHLVRNSLDHGIEPADVRRSKGKSEVGNIVISAEHQGGHIVIEIQDDGAGLNRERILAKARERGIELAENLSDDEVWKLIFAPGFSTAEAVTDVSGRGVGMDVVRRNIQEMGGHIEIESLADKGSTFRILLPLTLAILDGMSVLVGSETFILPLNSVMESLIPQSESLHPVGGHDYMLQVREEYLPLIELHRVFDVADANASISDSIAVVVQGAGRRFALLVDQLIGQQQVVVKNLELNYRKVDGISAATILGDGSVALIVDVASMPQIYSKKFCEPESN